MSEEILTMRTAFSAGGHAEVEPVMFALGVLRHKQRKIREQLRDVGWVPASELAVLEIRLGDPQDPVDAPLTAHVNAGRWLAQCDACGGAEHVDPQTRLFMCGGCFNAKHGHRWRLVDLPDPTTAALIEELLLKRPDVTTRGWAPDETITDLIVENVKHGVMKPGDEIRIEAQPGQPAQIPQPEVR